MFGIDPISYHQNTNIPEDERSIRNLYAEILRRALEDLRYYKQSDNIDRWIRLGAYNDARNAQAWIDGLIESCAITCEFILQTLEIDKNILDQYLDKHGIRFNYSDKSPKKRTGRTTHEIRPESTPSDRKDLHPLWINRPTTSPISRS